MPIIQEERGRRTIAGLPRRWAERAYRELSAAVEMPVRYKDLAAEIDRVTTGPIPIDATDAQLCIMAERRAAECMSVSLLIHDAKAQRVRLARMVENCGLTPPQVEDDRQYMLRCTDASWWRRKLRTAHGRMFEHAAVRFGYVSLSVGPYASNETVARYSAAKVRNARTLENVSMTNEDGYQATLAELSLKSVSNDAIRRGELMLRMKGCEEIANENGHVGVFVTLTCPSKYHAVLAKSGTANPNYNGANARDAQHYLTEVWKCIRAKNSRDGILPYGFRIAEPHHDGCPHWHILMFCAQDQVTRLTRNINVYALAEDRDEPGAARNRVKVIRIEASKGTAAGYIAKYVGKNIDGENVGAQLDRDGNVVCTDLVGDEIVRPAQRVKAWASTWGIRQFQPIGQPPVTVWREFRRVTAEQVQDAPEHVRAAWAACQRERYTDSETGEVITEQAASYSAYIRAQGGVNLGRNYRIGVAAPIELCEGRYGLSARPMPKGVYCKTAPETVYASTRHVWKRVIEAAVNDRPWTRVNNCTLASKECAPHWESSAVWQAVYSPIDESEYFANFDFSYFDSVEYRAHCLKE